MLIDGQAVARGQRVWLSCDDGFILDGESASMAEESLGDNREFSESRDQKRAWVVCYRKNHDKGEDEVEEARETRERRASVLTTDKEKDEYEVMRTVLRNWCNSCVRGRAKHSHRCPTSDPSRSLMAKDCRVSIRNVNENSPTVLVLFERTHGVERECQVSHEATEPHACEYILTLVV